MRYAFPLHPEPPFLHVGIPSPCTQSPAPSPSRHSPFSWSPPTAAAYAPSTTPRSDQPHTQPVQPSPPAPHHVAALLGLLPTPTRSSSPQLGLLHHSRPLGAYHSPSSPHGITRSSVPAAPSSTNFRARNTVKHFPLGSVSHHRPPALHTPTSPIMVRTYQTARKSSMPLPAPSLLAAPTRDPSHSASSYHTPTTSTSVPSPVEDSHATPLNQSIPSGIDEVKPLTSTSETSPTTCTSSDSSPSAQHLDQAASSSCVRTQSLADIYAATERDFLRWGSTQGSHQTTTP
ncbi:hypothetical protein GOP47_0011035 [Adiantum capillus-veneris]|uniref:Uncharacterized protein n=1 Tax=Adiantum capillus-veneris TaxID=13818 RepID=A0A9D4USI0_ADICA|nr:hypothetical protein GOP47_0011035 [Adiantum capillus-veneris]